jgi:hypothetical protein
LLDLRRSRLREGEPAAPARETAATRKKPSVGLLEEGLAALDAQRGTSRSSIAVSAGYQAAREHAPPQGVGVFEVRTDATGLVLSVSLLDAKSNQPSWRKVGESLAARLKGRRLRVPQGANGLATRLRIERGDLALELSERGRTERGVAIGEQPLHPREQRGESKLGERKGQLTPTLGTQVAGASQAHPTRIVLLSEVAL